MSTLRICFVLFVTLPQIIFHNVHGFVVGQPLPNPNLQFESVTKSEPLAIRQLTFNVDTGSGRRPGMFGGTNTFGDTALGVLRGSSLLLAETLVNAFSGITTFINMIQNYAQTGSFQLNNLSSSSQVLTNRLLDLGSNAATGVLNMLSNEMSSSAANGAASLSGFSAAVPSSQFITSDNTPIRPLQIDIGRQSTSTSLPVNGDTSGAFGISGQSTSISATQPQIGASFPGASNSPGVFGQRVGVTSASGGGSTGGTSGWNSVLGWGVPGNSVNWGSSGPGNSLSWGAPGWRGNPAAMAGWDGVNRVSGTSGVNGVSGSGGTASWSGTNGVSGLGGVSGVSGPGSTAGWASANGVPGSGGVNGVYGPGGWGVTNGVSGSGDPFGMAGWYSPNVVGGWYSPSSGVGWRGSPVGIWGPVGGLSGSAAPGGLSGWGGPMIGWRGPPRVGGWGSGVSGSGTSGGTFGGGSGGLGSGTSSGTFGWGAPNGVISWSGPTGMSGWGVADNISGSGNFGGVSGWDNSLGLDTDTSGMDFMSDFAMYGAGSSNTTSPTSPLLQFFETIVNGRLSQPTTGKLNSPSGSSLNSGKNNSTIVNP